MTARDIGLTIVHRLPWLNGLARDVYRRLPEALHDTPTTLLRNLFRHDDSICFLQIGAFDGVAGDPLRPLVTTDARWRGVLVEPQPHVFDRLKANYAPQASRLQFLPCAVSDTDAERPLYFVAQSEIDRLGLPAWAGEVASFNRAHVQKHFPQAMVASVDIDVRTIAQITRAAGLERVDAIVMDVEGHEQAIIQDVDWNALGVRACLFEHKHMDGATFGALMALFQSEGFHLKRYGRDAVAFRRAPPEPNRSQ